jgi:hypothetical protein
MSPTQSKKNSGLSHPRSPQRSEREYLTDRSMSSRFNNNSPVYSRNLSKSYKIVEPGNSYHTNNDLGG